ncbi:phage tail tube protein [Hyalangium versicolor]|uniref:phage tail tube protein n=1 Tax=Hyalangium versicolor TaxID=2861190 RepID=UPI001CCDD9A6|nr:hypothetical protein [Hyalangium versicolor]
MSDEYHLAHLDDIHVTATADEELSESNKLEALRSFKLTETTEQVEQKFLNSDGWTRNTPTFKSASGTFSGDVKKNSDSQAVLVNANRNRRSFFVTVIKSSTASAGSRGERWELVIESAEDPREAGQLVTYSYSVKANGAPTAV